MRVFQNGLNSLLVTWAASGGGNITGYTIFYQQIDGGHSGLVEVKGTDTSISIRGLISGATYEITIVANLSTFQSAAATASPITIGKILLIEFED